MASNSAKPGNAQDSRGERLYPPRSSRLYWVLTCLRRQMEAFANSHLQNLESAQLADFGCGNMPYRPLLSKYVNEYRGYDLAGNSLADEFLTEDFLFPLPEESVDVVLSTQVLEHVVDPNAYLREAHRVLRPGAILAISTHGHWKYHPDPTDFWRWTCDGLTKTLEEAGFEIIEMSGALGLTATAMQLLQDGTSTWIPRRLKRVYYLFTQQLVRAFDLATSDASRNKDACVFFAVCRKAD